MNPTNEQAQRQIAQLVEQLQRAIKHMERRVDVLVFGLYGLTKEEVKIIEQI